MIENPDDLHLSAGEITLHLVPWLGGSVAAFRFRTTDLFRPLSDEGREARRVVDAGMFPMVPYANRLAGNLIRFHGREIHVRANNPPERFNVHGTGWHRPWKVEHLGPAEARLVLDLHDEPEAWTYRARQSFALDGSGLGVILELENTGPETMPFGFGLHPWFPRDRDTVLGFGARWFHQEGPDMVALPAGPLPADFPNPGPLPDWRLNNDFGGWSGQAELEFPSRGVALRISADPVFGHLMIYADPEQPFFCVEPQSNAAGGLGRDPTASDPKEGVILLEPGEMARGRIRFDVLPLAPSGQKP